VIPHTTNSPVYPVGTFNIVAIVEDIAGIIEVISGVKD
jgi:hypothetical protein